MQIRNILNLERRGTMIQLAIFDLVNWNLLGTLSISSSFNKALADLAFSSSSDVAKFFQASIDCIVQAVLDQIKSAQISVSCFVPLQEFQITILVPACCPGRGVCCERLALWESQNNSDQQRTRCDTSCKPRVRWSFCLDSCRSFYLSRNKAVSDGAISFYLDHYVRTRVAKVTYGVELLVRYDEKDPEHVKRSASKFTHVDGTVKLRHGFRTVLAKVWLKCPCYFRVLISSRIPKFLKRKNLCNRCTSTILIQRNWQRSLSRWCVIEATRVIHVGSTLNLVSYFFFVYPLLINPIFL